MAVAIAYPEAEKGGRGQKRNSKVTLEFSGTLLMQARAIIREFGVDSEQVMAVPTTDGTNHGLDIAAG